MATLSVSLVDQSYGKRELKAELKVDFHVSDANVVSGIVAQRMIHVVAPATPEECAQQFEREYRFRLSMAMQNAIDALTNVAVATYRSGGLL